MLDKSANEKARGEVSEVLLQHFQPALLEKFYSFFSRYMVYNAGHKAALVRMQDAVRVLNRRVRNKDDWDINIDDVVLEIAAQCAWIYLGRRGLLKDAPASLLDERMSEILAEMEDTRIHYSYLEALRDEMRAQRIKSNYELKRLRAPRRYYTFLRRGKHMERKIGVAFGNGRVSRSSQERIIPEEEHQS